MKLLQFSTSTMDLDTGENGEAYRGLLLGRQTWNLHDCDGLMVVRGACSPPNTYQLSTSCRGTLPQHVFVQIAKHICPNCQIDLYVRHIW